MNKRILFIDDEPEFIYPQIEALEDSGYEVVLKTNPDEGFSELLKNDYDLIILDIIMPTFNYITQETIPGSSISSNESGVDLHRKIVDTPKLSKIPIVFLSVVRGHDIRAKLIDGELKRGHKPTFITKPASSSTVVEEVEKVLHNIF
jgi:CheY-like chemotaxis protein